MIVLDSSFLIAFHNDRDVHHPAARAIMPRLIQGEWGPALLPEYVFVEVTTVIALKRDLLNAAQVGSVLLNAREVEFVPCSSLFQEAWRFFRTQGGDSILSFVDSAIATLARQHGAQYLATFDSGFRKVSGLTLVPAL